MIIVKIFLVFVTQMTYIIKRTFTNNKFKRRVYKLFTAIKCKVTRQKMLKIITALAQLGTIIISVKL